MSLEETFLAALRMVIKIDVLKKEWYFTERNSIHSKFTIGLIPKMIKGA
jgi:hypothetical protein